MSVGLLANVYLRVIELNGARWGRLTARNGAEKWRPGSGSQQASQGRRRLQSQFFPVCRMYRLKQKDELTFPLQLTLSYHTKVLGTCQIPFSSDMAKVPTHSHY
jgi:hypothetical protein